MRGQKSEVGDERTSNNGYVYVRTEDKWRLKHHVIMEEKLGRPIDTEVEIVYFVDRNRQNLDPDNIDIRLKKAPPKEEQIANISATIEELQAKLESLQAS